jgi:hypothetical protein
MVLLAGLLAGGTGGLPPLDRRDCGGTVRCTTVRVPLDWARPGGAQITLAVAQRPADVPAERLGVLLFSPGTASAVDQLVRYGAGFPAELTRRFDLVAWCTASTCLPGADPVTTYDALLAHDALPAPGADHGAGPAHPGRDRGVGHDGRLRRLAGARRRPAPVRYPEPVRGGHPVQPLCPYPQELAFARGATVLDWTGDGHIAYLLSPCVQAAVDAFLTTAHPPATRACP